MTEEDPRIGSVLDGKYRIEGLIGQGGFGRVYRATHLGIKATVAIKFLHAEMAEQSTVRARFRREAIALGRLRHPAIVTVHDVGEDGAVPYIVMELIRGRPLSELILVDGEPLPYERLGVILDQVLEVLEEAHGAGVVHRDLKPENILLLDGTAGGGPDRVKVLDFGLALLQEAEGDARLTTSREINGTPFYMSPEQCEGGAIGPPSDIYAAGVMLYELLATVLPFQAGTTMQLIAQHMFVQPPPISERGLHRAAPPQLESLVTWAMNKRAADRPTATQLRIALAAALGEMKGATKSTRGLPEAKAAAAPEAGKSREGLDLRHSLLKEVAEGLLAPLAAPVSGARSRVALWGCPAQRAEALRMALGVNGLDVDLWPEGAMAADRGAQVQAVLLGWDGQAAARLRQIRGDDTLGKKPVLVIDIGEVDETASLIRAGASDAALLGAPDEQLCRKLLRLVRRGR